MPQTGHKLGIPHVADVVREILEEHGTPFRAGSDVCPGVLKRESRGGLRPRLEAMPKRSFALVPCLAERFVEAVIVAALAHHPLKGGRGGPGHGPEGKNLMHGKPAPGTWA